MTQALYNKWRPQKWDEIIGQQHVVQTLRNAITGDHVVHAYLFAGPRGTGKTTTARLLAKAVNCLSEVPEARPCNECAHCTAVNESRFLDLIEIDAASQNGVEDVRDLRDKVNFSPNQGRYKIYIIDEVHMFSTNAFNALLKTLEEPPAHAIFILATTEINKIPSTVLSRCQRHEFRRVPAEDIQRQLQVIAKQEGLTVEAEALSLIARQSAGGLRDAISLLDQMASTGKEISLELTQAVLGTATSQTVLDVIGAVVEQKPAEGLEAIHKALDSGADPRQLARQVVDYLRALLLIQMGNSSQADLTRDVRTQAEKHARSLSRQDVLQLILAFNNAATELRSSWQPSLPLELALAEAIKTPNILNQVSVPTQAENKPAKGKEEPAAVSPASSKETGKAETASEVQEKPQVTLAQVSKVWKQIRERLRSQPALVALLNSARLMEIKNGVLVLGFASEVLRSKMDPGQMDLTRKAITELLGKDLSLQCVITNAKQPPAGEVNADGMVAAAIKAGGEIVDIQE
jgi:DNA polymerase-3 subunit gamma/tau